MAGQTNINGTENQNGTEIKIREINGEVMISNGDLGMIKIYIHGDKDVDVIYVMVEKFKEWINVIGVGLTFDDALRDAKWRADQYDDMGTIQRVEMLEREFYARIYERGRGEDNEWGHTK